MVRNHNRSAKNMINRSLLSYTSPQSLTGSEFRSIRNSIDYAGRSRKIGSIMITSPGMNEGKTTTAINLAISKAQHGEKVLLIDANIQNPNIHEVFHMKLIPGLTNVLAGQIPLEEAAVSTEIGHLDILSFGPMLFNAVELLDSKDMNRLLDLAKDRYDFVIVDSAPVLEDLDANSLASKCDGAVLVIKEGKTNRESALQAKRLLEVFAKAAILGVVFNKKKSR